LWLDPNDWLLDWHFELWAELTPDGVWWLVITIYEEALWWEDPEQKKLFKKWYMEYFKYNP